MIGYRNASLIIVAIATSTWLGYVGIQAGSDLLALATLVGAKDAMVAASIFGRGYNKKVQGVNGGAARLPDSPA